MTELKQGRWVELNGRTTFYEDGEFHRDNDQPAIIWRDGSKFWYQKGKSHRLSGPSDIYASGNKNYYINGKQLTKEEWENHPEVKKYKLQQILNKMLGQ